MCGKCFWPVCSSECGRCPSHRAECATLSAFARRSEDELAPLRHLLPLRCLLLRNRRDRRAWEELLRMEVSNGCIPLTARLLNASCYTFLSKK